MKNLLKVDTWLPMFSGFYGTLWETDSDEEMEIEHINEKRAEKGLPECSYDDVEWAWADYQKEVVEGMTAVVGDYLKDKGFINAYTSPKLISPREYNFTNDSINVTFTLDSSNQKTIMNYLSANKEAFTKYVEDHYTSYDGFMSSYSNDVDQWLNDEEMLSHEHKLGAVLNFIMENEEGVDFEMSAYENLHGNGAYLTASNYSKLTEVA